MRKWLWLLFLVWFCPNAPAQAAELVIACEDFPPYEYLEQGKPAGLSVELVSEICQRLGLTPRFVFSPWTEALASAREGRVMAIMSLSRNPERDQFLVFPDRRLSEERIIAMSRRDSVLRLQGIDDLAKHRLGVNPDYDYGIDLNEIPGLRLVPARNLETLVQDLLDQRTDFALGNELTLDFVARKLKRQHAVIRARTMAALPLYIAFARSLGPRAAELAASFDQTLKAMEDEGTAAIIRGQY